MFDHDTFFNIDMPEAYEAVYIPEGGERIDTVVFIDRNVETFPGGYETGVSEKRVEITLRSDHAPTPRKGDIIAISNESFTVAELLDSDSFSNKVSV